MNTKHESIVKQEMRAAFGGAAPAASCRHHLAAIVSHRIVASSQSVEPLLWVSNACVILACLSRHLSVHAEQREKLSQSVGPQPYRACNAVALRDASVALRTELRLKSGMQALRASAATPNPSVKRTLHGLAKFMRKKPRINSANPFRAAYFTR